LGKPNLDLPPPAVNHCKKNGGEAPRVADNSKEGGQKAFIGSKRNGRRNQERKKERNQQSTKKNTGKHSGSWDENKGRVRKKDQNFLGSRPSWFF